MPGFFPDVNDHAEPLIPSSPTSNYPTTGIGVAGSMFSKLKEAGSQASNRAKQALEESKLRESAVQFGERVGSEISQASDRIRESAPLPGLRESAAASLESASSSIREKTGTVRESVAVGSQGLRDKVGTAGSSIRDMGATASAAAGIDAESLPGIPRSSPPRERSRMEIAEREICALFPALSFQHRVIGCISCMAIGYTLSFGGFMRLSQLIVGNPGPFVVTTTMGNVVSLCGSCFLTGPTSQAKKMFHETRRIATTMYLGSLFLTILVAYALEDVKGQGLLLIMLVLMQYVAIAWYCLSYIPFAREIAQRMFRRIYTQVADEDIV